MTVDLNWEQKPVLIIEIKDDKWANKPDECQRADMTQMCQQYDQDDRWAKKPDMCQSADTQMHPWYKQDDRWTNKPDMCWRAV